MSIDLKDLLDQKEKRIKKLRDLNHEFYKVLFNLRQKIGGTPTFEQADQIMREYEKRVIVK